MAGLSARRAYLIALALSALFLLGSPVSLLVVFLSGDSCCGENTTGTMAAVTAVIVVAACAIGGGLALALRDPVQRPGYRPLLGWALISGPVSLVHVLFVTAISLFAF